MAIASIALGVWPYISRDSSETNVYRSTVPLPPDVRLGGVPPVARLAISPDGRRLAYVARDADGALRLWVRALDGTVTRPLAGTEGAWAPFWSPDSRSLGFFTATDRKLKRIDAGGGPAITLCDLDGALPPGWGGSWSRDGIILFAHDGFEGIQRISAAGGSVSPVTALDADAGETRHGVPYFLPDGRHFLYLATGRKDGGPNDANGVYVASIDSPGRTLLLPHGSNVSYASGHLLFLQGQTLMAQPFDLAALELRGEPVPVSDEVSTGGGSGGPFANSGGFSVSQRNVLAYNRGQQEPQTQLLWFDRNGRRLDVLGAPAGYYGAELSPDGTRAATTLTNFTASNEVWLFDVKQGVRTRLTLDAGDQEGHVWSPDGRRIVRRAGSDLRQKEIGGMGREDVLLSDGLAKRVGDWSRDGQFILYASFDVMRRDDDLWVLPLARGAKPFRFTQTAFREYPGRFSPDGRWIAYASSESGQPEVFVAGFPGPGGKWQVSVAGGSDPRWRRDARELYYVSPDGTLMAAQVSRSTGFAISGIEPLFRTRMRTGPYQYDVTADGQRFLINTLTSQTSLESIELVINWTAELR